MSARVLGTHEGCGGQVVYQTSTAMGWRSCDRCHASTLRGQSVETVTPKADHDAMPVKVAS